MCFMHELEAAMNPALLHNGESVKLLSNVLKTNVSACTLIGREFYFSVAGRCARRLSAEYRSIEGCRGVESYER